MRRVFPLRPAEANVLIAYQNEAFEPHTGNDFPVKHQTRAATTPSMDESVELITSQSARKTQEGSGDQYPVFNGGYCSPRSPLSVGSCRDSERDYDRSSVFCNMADDACDYSARPTSSFISAICSSVLSSSASRWKATQSVVDGALCSTIKQKLDEPFTPFASNPCLLQAEAVPVSRKIFEGPFLPFSNGLCGSSYISEDLRKESSDMDAKSKGRFAFLRLHSFLRYFTACLLTGKSMKLVRNQSDKMLSESTATESNYPGDHEQSTAQNAHSAEYQQSPEPQQYEIRCCPLKCRSLHKIGAKIHWNGDVLCSFEKAASFHNHAGSDSVLVSDGSDKRFKETIGNVKNYAPCTKACWCEEEVYLHQFVSLKNEVIRLWKDKRRLDLELLAEIKTRMSERSASESAIKHMQSEMQVEIKSLEREHESVRGRLEQELERKEKEWDRRMAKVQKQERKLRERIIQLVEEKANLEKDVSSYRSREVLLQSQARDCEKALQIGIDRCRKSEEEVVLLNQKVETALIQLREKEREAEISRQQTKNLEVEKRDLLREFCRLTRATEEQNITFEELSKILIDLVKCPPEFKEQVLAEVHRDIRRLALKEVALLNEIGCLRAELSLINSPNAEDKDDSMISIKPEECSSVACRENEPSKEEICELEKLLSLANKQITDLEHEINAKDRELDRQQLNLQKSSWELSELQRELNWTKMERDGFCRQAECKNQECMKLNVEVAKLKKMVEKLDEELMLKEGEISILREAHISDSDF